MADVYVLTADPATEQLLRHTLATADMDVQPGEAATRSERLAVIVATKSAWREGLEQLPAAMAEAVRLVTVPEDPESYTLRIAEADFGSYILLLGGDVRGTYYAAQTLRQLLEAAESAHGEIWIPALEIPDRPAFGMRGIIEGFYGPPWSHQTRLDLLEFMGRYKMNTYVYAPKDDPYHRELWREPYPPVEKARLAELVEKAQAHHVDFVFAISPGLSIEYGSDADFERLVQKTEAMWELGVRHFALLLDDIDRELIHPTDRERFGADIGAAHAYLVNRYNRYLKEKGAARLMMVPIDYYQPGPTPYRSRLARDMDREVLVFWTGMGVVVPTITADEARHISSVYGNELLIWENYPVNDFRRTRLFLGPLAGRDPDLAQAVAGLLANPMNEGEASKIPLMTVADYLWNPDDYDALAAWDEALRRKGGAAYPALRRLAEVSTESALHPAAPSPVKELLDAVWPGVEAATALGDPSKVEALPVEVLSQLRQEFEAWQLIPTELADGLSNDRLYQELAPYADKMRRYGIAGLHALDALAALVHIAETPEDPDVRGELWEAYYYLKLAKGQAAALSQEIAAGRLPDLLAGVEDAAHRTLHPGVIPQPYTSYTSHYGDFAPQNMVDGDPTTFFWTNRGARAGEFVGVDLGELQLIDAVTVQFNQRSGSWARPNDYPKAARIQVSADGNFWRNVGFTAAPAVLVQFEPVWARYVRILMLTDQTEWVQVTDIVVRTVDETAPRVASAIVTDPRPVGDSLLASYVRLPRGTIGEVLHLTLAEGMSLAGVELFVRPDAPLNGARLEVSADGAEWTTLGALSGAHGYWSLADGPAAVRHVRLVLDEPLPADGYLHEIVLHQRPDL